MEVTTGIVTGILAGLIASAIFYLMMHIIRPKILLSDKICRRKIDDNGNELIEVKVVNKTKAMLMNSKYSMYLETVYEDNLIDIEEVKPVKSNLKCIERYNRKDEKARYAVRFSYSINRELLKQKGVRLSFVIFGKHAWSNTSSYVRKIYQVKDIVDGIFQKGTSLDIILNK